MHGSEERTPETRSEVEAGGGEVASEAILADVSADELHRLGVSVETYTIADVTGPASEDAGNES